MKELPKISGVYYFFNAKNEILYVGKAANLKSRIISHLKANEFHREGLFLARMTRKIKHERKQDDLPEELQFAWNDFEFRSMSQIQPIVIDYIFHNIAKIGYEEIPKELTESKEKKEIEKYHPSFNSQTASEEYYEVQENFE